MWCACPWFFFQLRPLLPCLCPHPPVLDFDLWNRAGAFQVGWQETSHWCLFIFCQRKLWLNCNYMFLFGLWPNHGEQLAFQLSNDLTHGCNSKCLCFSLFVIKAVALGLYEAVASTSNAVQSPGDLGLGLESNVLSFSDIVLKTKKKKILR